MPWERVLNQMRHSLEPGNQALKLDALAKEPEGFKAFGLLFFKKPLTTERI